MAPWWPWGEGGGGPGGRPAEGPLSLLPVVLCGMSGFSDFYKLRWLQAILSWQKPREGCFGEPGELHFLPDWEWAWGGWVLGFHARWGKDAVVLGVWRGTCNVHHDCPCTHVHKDTQRCWGRCSWKLPVPPDSEDLCCLRCEEEGA